MRSKEFSRIRFLSFFVIALGAIFVVRLYFLQIVYGSSFKSRADHQYANPTQDIYDRGSIFFTEKDGTKISAANIKSGFFLAINPKLITEPEVVYKKLSSTMTIDHDSFISKASKKSDSYEEIIHRLSSDQASSTTALRLPGVTLYREQWRFYPGDSMAANTVGFVAFKGDELAGRYGLESQYEDVLTLSSQNVYVNFFAQMFSDLHKLVSQDTTEGDITTTIEPTVQLFLQDQLKKTNDTFNSTMTGGIIINPQTGEIYSLGTFPTFNPNNFQSEKSSAVFSNPLVENVYEMGSIVKPLTVAAGLDAKVVTATSTYNDTGSIILNGKKISNFDGVARGVIPTQEILSQSLNVGAAFVERKIGNKAFANYFANYGIGEKTGIDLPNEAHGLTDNLKSPRDVEYATASFGQGIAISPMSITRALSVLANGGWLITPHVTKEIDYSSGSIKTIPTDKTKQVISEQASKEITRMLVTVVDKALLEGTVKIPGYSVAAKTGTAQMANPNGGGYYSDRYLHSFFGYFPAYDPKYLVFLYTVYPKNVSYASHTLTQPFINIVKFLINYYDIPPDR